MRNSILMLSLIFAAACVSAARVSTVEERTTAHQVLTLIDTAIVTATAIGKVTPADAALAHQQVVALRAKVDDTAVVPVYWADVLNEVLLMATAWAVKTN